MIPQARIPSNIRLKNKESSTDSHATGVLGATGRGTAEHFGLVGEVDIITSTLGKALGGAAGGFVAGSAALCAPDDTARASFESALAFVREALTKKPDP